MDCDSRVLKGFLKVLWLVSGCCLVGVCCMSGRCLVDNLSLSCCLEGILKVSRMCRKLQEYPFFYPFLLCIRPI